MRRQLIFVLLSVMLIIGCATGPVQKSRFDKGDQMFGFLVNNSDNFIAVKIKSVATGEVLRNGKAVIIRPYWATVGNERDYFEAPDKRDYDNRHGWNKPNDPRLEKIHPGLLKHSPRMNAVKLLITPGKYEVQLCVITLIDKTQFEVGPWGKGYMRLKEGQSTPFTWDYDPKKKKLDRGKSRNER